VSARTVTDPRGEAARYNSRRMTFDPPASGSFPQAPPAPSLVGEVLDGRYRILKKLGEGGMGEVYAAEHVHIEKRVAVKLLRPEIVSNKEAVSRFRQEARSASSIGHKNIIAIEDFGSVPDGRIYLCMELLNGAPLNDMIKEPMALQPIGVGMKKDEPALLAKVNEALTAMDKDGEIDQLWAKWLGPNTEYKLVREEKVMPLSALKFTPLP